MPKRRGRGVNARRRRSGSAARARTGDSARRGSSSRPIGIMRPDGSGERILTEGYHNEGPTWSPNGRVVMLFRDPGGDAGPMLFTVDVTGRNEQPLNTPSYASDPSWSPLLQFRL